MIEKIIDDIIVSEGSTYTNEKDDPGGPTKYGITLETLKAFRKNTSVTSDDVKALTRDEAVAIYKDRYITTPKFDQIKNQWVQYAVIDFGVNSGVGRAARNAQQLLNDTFGKKLSIDGQFGPMSLEAINSVDQTKFFFLYNTIRIRFLGEIHNDTYINGWLKRVTKIIDDFVKS